MADMRDFISIGYQALDVFNRELTAFIPGTPVNAKLARASLDEVIRVPRATVGDIEEIARKGTKEIPDADTGTLDYTDVKMEKIEKISIKIDDGEEQAGVQHSGNWETIMKERFEDAYRKFANKIEGYLAEKYIAGAGGVINAFGTVPFTEAGNIKDASALGKVFDDAGVSRANRVLVLDTTSSAEFIGVNGLKYAQQWSDDKLLHNGLIARGIAGFDIRTTGATMTPFAGEVAGAGYTVLEDCKRGTRRIKIEAGSGAIPAGAMVTIGKNNYVVLEPVTSAADDLVISGLREDITAGTAITKFEGKPGCCVAYQRDAMAFGTRLPYIPNGKDSAVDSTVITDPVTGISFDLRWYTGYRMNQLEMSIAYGAKAVNNSNICLLQY